MGRTSASVYMGIVARLGCVVCKRIYGRRTPAEVHHVAEGSGLRSDFSVAPLCHEHHQGVTGLHGMGTKAFIRLYRPPGDSEYGLLVWTAEDLAEDLKDAVNQMIDAAVTAAKTQEQNEGSGPA